MIVWSCVFLSGSVTLERNETNSASAGWSTTALHSAPARFTVAGCYVTPSS